MYAMVFPGQGSQSVGMLQALAASYPVVADTFHEASTVLGYDLWQLVQQDSEGRLNQTEVTQPAVLVAGVAVWRVWQTLATTAPSFLAGHSLGEYTALVAAESLEFLDAVKLVQQRGRLMQNAESGAMVAIVGLDQAAINQVCEQAAHAGVLEVANHNSPLQVVLAGELAAVQAAERLAKEAGATVAKILAVSVPAHCSLMRPAAEQFAEILAAVSLEAPRVPVIQNVEVACYRDVEQIRDDLVRQLYRRVRWVETVQWMVERGVQAIWECGPGRVLTGLNRKIVRELRVGELGDPAKLEAALAG